MKSLQRCELRRVAALGDEGLVHQALGHDDMRQGIDHRDVGAGLQRQMIVGLDMRRCCTRSMRRGSMTISLAPSRRRRFIREANTGWRVGRVGADDHDHVGLVDRVEILRAGRGAERRLQAIAGGRMADARAGVDVVVAEGGAHHLLHQEGFFVGAARRGDAADGVAAVLRLDALELAGGVADRLFPGHFLPRIGDLLADHRLE